MTAIVPCSPDVAKKVGYEFKMFRFLCQNMRLESEESQAYIPGNFQICGTGHSEEEPDMLRAFALLESLLLHARVLRDFFFKRKKDKNDDVLASDFLPDWVIHCPPEGTYLAGQTTRLNKALAHLTTARVEYDAKEKHWKVGEIYCELGPVIDKFLEKLPPDRKGWFEYHTKQP